MIDWLITLLPYEKYGGYILASYTIGFIVLLGLFTQSIRAKKQIIKQLNHKYNRENK